MFLETCNATPAHVPFLNSKKTSWHQAALRPVYITTQPPQMVNLTWKWGWIRVHCADRTDFIIILRSLSERVWRSGVSLLRINPVQLQTIVKCRKYILISKKTNMLLYNVNILSNNTEKMKHQAQYQDWNISSHSSYRISALLVAKLYIHYIC